MKYTITGIHRENGAISEVRLENKDSISVDVVIAWIGRGHEYHTRDKYGRTAKVNVVDKNHLRTNPNRITSDNLDKMETY